MIREQANPVGWHAISGSDALTRLGSREAGLDDAEVIERRKRFGDNFLLVSSRTPWWEILRRQLSSLIVALLAAATIGAWLVGDRLEAIAILVVLALNTGLGFGMEMWARQTMDSLRRLEVQRATVRRGSETRSVDSRELVPGDIILVEAGEAIPADGRLLRTTELRVVEAPLTGESEPAAKTSYPVACEVE
jgi:Ca2+-transporting ATPase